jgi:hypothetical protein
MISIVVSHVKFPQRKPAFLPTVRPDVIKWDVQLMHNNNRFVGSGECHDCVVPSVRPRFVQQSNISFERRGVVDKGFKKFPVFTHVGNGSPAELQVMFRMALNLVSQRTEKAIAVTKNTAELQAKAFKLFNHARKPTLWLSPLRCTF